MRTLVWFRGKDLRLADHAPLRDAAAAGEVVPLFVLDPCFFAPERARAIPHRIQFLLESLRELDESVARRGSRLFVVAGRSVDVVPRLAEAWRVDRVVAHGWVAPVGRERDRRVAAALRVPFDLYEGETLLPPGMLRAGTGRPFAVFGHFERAFVRAASIDAPLAAPRSLPPIPRGVTAATVAVPTLADLDIERNASVLAGGEAAGRRRLREFLDDLGPRYPETRDLLAPGNTSRLSVDLKFGTLSVRTVWHRIAEALGPGSAATAKLHRELVWRDFTHTTLWDRPELATEPFRPGFRGFPYLRDEAGLAAWTEGRTGFPVVDASARQLLAEGFVPNRARMIAASFLTKQLLVDYRRGEAHYLRHLTDGDWAQNNFNWQWCAGCGCDAQPYFRLFNPVLQGERHDPEGAYVRRWVPELAKLPARYIHAPWTAPPEVLRTAGLVLPRDYPAPIVDLGAARARFLAVARDHLAAARRRG
jgi:deoxyribodipyrimidine photo-lyase